MILIMQIHLKYYIFYKQVQKIVTHVRFFLFLFLFFYNLTDAVITKTDDGNSKIFGKTCTMQIESTTKTAEKLENLCMPKCIKI